MEQLQIPSRGKTRTRGAHQLMSRYCRHQHHAVRALRGSRRGYLFRCHLHLPTAHAKIPAACLSEAMFHVMEANVLS